MDGKTIKLLKCIDNLTSKQLPTNKDALRDKGLYDIVLLTYLERHEYIFGSTIGNENFRLTPKGKNTIVEHRSQRLSMFIGSVTLLIALATLIITIIK